MHENIVRSRLFRRISDKSFALRKDCSNLPLVSFEILDYKDIICILSLKINMFAKLAPLCLPFYRVCKQSELSVIFHHQGYLTENGYVNLSRVQGILKGELNVFNISMS